MHNFLLSVIFLFLWISIPYLAAQDARKISGVVSDKLTGEPLGFATVRCNHHPTGTISNENGEFEFLVSKELYDDSIVVSYLGYESQIVPLNVPVEKIFVELSKAAINLREVKILPVPPEWYLKMAIRRIRQNYPDNPFLTRMYYREKLIENNRFVSNNEAVFKSYCTGYSDTAANQHQLLLFRRGDVTGKIEFMHEQAEKSNMKKKKMAEKKGKKFNEDEGNELKVLLGGPEVALTMDVLKGKEPLLDSLEFHKYLFSYDGISSFTGRNLIIIRFESKGTVEHTVQKGKIFLDAETFAVVSVECSAEAVIPIYIKPLLFIMGISCEYIDFEIKLKYYNVSGKWYPNDFEWLVKAGVTKHYWLKANEHSDFLIEQALIVNHVFTENISPIPEEKRFKHDKKPEEQIFNDSQIAWSDVNVLQK